MTTATTTNTTRRPMKTTAYSVLFWLALPLPGDIMYNPKTGARAEYLGDGEYKLDDEWFAESIYVHEPRHVLAWLDDEREGKV